MEETEKRLLPCDICGFERIRKGGYVYLDKTEYVYRLTHSGFSYVYLSRPRRFGKSMLLDTLACYFEGRRDLFEGLRMADLEREWTARPVIRLDMSVCMGELQLCKQQLAGIFARHERTLGITDGPQLELGKRFEGIVTAYADRGELPAVLIDEYDAPLVNQYVLKKKGEENELEEFTKLYRSLFINLKSLGSSLHFVFLTGCTRFNNMSIFSVLNNLQNISFDSDYGAVCGFTQGELEATYAQELDVIAAKRGESRGATLAMLCKHYDGYLFCDSPVPERVYNPFSVVRALNQMTKRDDDARRFRPYWTGTSGGYALQEWAQELEGLLGKLPQCSIPYNRLLMGDITTGDPLLLFYQAGYLTIDHVEGDSVTLRIPNGEIGYALFEQLLPTLLGCGLGDYDRPLRALGEGLRSGDIEKGLWAAKKLIGEAPWGITDSCLFESGVEDAARSSCRIRSDLSVGPKSSGKGAAPEERAALLFTFLCYSIPFRVRCEPHQPYGQPDRVIDTGQFIYVVEFKRPSEGGLARSWKQMRERRYVEPYVAEAIEWGHRRTVVALTIEVRDDGKALVDWQAKVYASDESRLLPGKVRKSAERWRQLEEALEAAD